MSHSSLRIDTICMLQPGRERSAQKHSECAAVEEEAQEEICYKMKLTDRVL